MEQEELGNQAGRGDCRSDELRAQPKNISSEPPSWYSLLVLGRGGVIPRHLNSIGLEWLQGSVLSPKLPEGLSCVAWISQSLL